MAYIDPNDPTYRDYPTKPGYRRVAYYGGGTFDPRYYRRGELGRYDLPGLVRRPPIELPPGQAMPKPLPAVDPGTSASVIDEGFTIAGLDFKNVPTWAWIAAGAVLFFMFGKK